MAFSAISRLTRPKSFLYLMTLRTGTELIILTMLINKVTGVYGILAIFTGYHLSPLQLTMYIYSIIALILTIYLSPHIRKQTPLQCLALAWFYFFDSIINAGYTAAFSVSWFLILAKHTAPLDGAGGGIKGPGSDTIADTAGFSNPAYNVSHVEVTGLSAATLIGHVTDDAVANGGVLGNTILQSGSIASVIVITLLWACRIYFMLVVMAYARGVLRQSIVASSTSHGFSAVASKMADAEDESSAGRTAGTPYLENPFLDTAGWSAKLGRTMVLAPKSYWLGVDDEGDARRMRDFSRRLDRTSTTGVVERERRRRAGTGPPILKPLEMGNLKW